MKRPKRKVVLHGILFAPTEKRWRCTNNRCRIVWTYDNVQNGLCPVCSYPVRLDK